MNLNCFSSPFMFRVRRILKRQPPNNETFQYSHVSINAFIVLHVIINVIFFAFLNSLLNQTGVCTFGFFQF